VACFAAVYVPLRFARALAAAGALALLAAIPASADRGSDREVATRIVAELKKGRGSSTFAKEPLEKAEHALGRASDARASGDHVHGAELEALAHEWARTAADLVRAAAVENQLATVQKQLSETETKLLRARAVLEETVARRGRAKTELDKLEAERGGAKPAPPPPAEPKKP
jgi:colicin import membrane protein